MNRIAAVVTILSFLPMCTILYVYIDIYRYIGTNSNEQTKRYIWMYMYVFTHVYYDLWSYRIVTLTSKRHAHPLKC